MISIEQRLFAIILCHFFNKRAKVWYKGFWAYRTTMFNIDNRHEVLLIALHNRGHVVELLLPIDIRTVKMVATHTQTHTTCFSQVTLISIVNKRGALCCFKINIRNRCTINHLIPVNTTLVMRHIDTFFILGIDASIACTHKYGSCMHHTLFAYWFCSQRIRFITDNNRSLTMMYLILFTRLYRTRCWHEQSYCQQASSNFMYVAFENLFHIHVCKVINILRFIQENRQVF